MDLESMVLYAFMFFIMVATSYILTVTINGLDMSTWNFVGSEFIKGVLPSFPLIFLAVGCGVITLVAWSKQK